MKSERRHELQHNALAAWMVKSFETIQPYQNFILNAYFWLLVGVLFRLPDLVKQGTDDLQVTSATAR